MMIKKYVVEHKSMLLLAALVLLVAFPFVISNAYYQRIFIMIFLYAVLAMSLNLITGVAGQLALGHGGFYCVGAYASALLIKSCGMPFTVSLIGAAIISALFGLALGIPCLRLRGDYLTLCSIGFAEIVRLVALHWDKLTGGALGVKNIPAVNLFGFVFKNNMQYYFLFLIVMVIVYIFINRIISSQTGRALISIREDEIAASAMGINLTYYKVLAFVVAAVLAGIMGAFMAAYLTYLNPQSFILDESFLMLQMIILGGLGSNFGAIIGAAILVFLPEAFRFLTDYRMLINGFLMVGLMAWRPQGLFGATTTTEAIVKKLIPPELVKTAESRGVENENS
ncbi:MAG: branched-chain amino acid ABC transporter permease [Clostridiales bacterium]|nr:branched-chain amino acid ABC transporter permease [Clostridiales bacterium]